MVRFDIPKIMQIVSKCSNLNYKFYCCVVSDQKKTFAKIFLVSKSFTGWLLFILLSIIWGSSFILMKLGIAALSAYQVASIRIASASIILLPFAAGAFRAIPKEKRLIVLSSGLLGSFFPAFLYCVAETKIDSSLAAILNSLTPLFTIVIGILFFHSKINSKKIIGIIVGLIGLILLPSSTHESIGLHDLSYALLVLLATICYAINVNVVSRHLQQVASLQVASLAFCFLLLPAIVILTATGYFSLPLSATENIHATLAAATLGVFGTAIATILFYMLVKTEGALFASLVTYGIPVIAVIWGIMYGEQITIAEILCLLVILSGVYIVNRK